MRILHVITQKPFATGSGVYLTGIIRELGHRHEQYLICGINAGDEAQIPLEDHRFTIDPLVFASEDLPFPVPGMSDVMPYRSTLYARITEEQAEAMLQRFLAKIDDAVERFAPDVVLFEHLYLLTARAASHLREKGCRLPLLGICHGSELRQFGNTDRWRGAIRSGIGCLDRLITTHGEQAAEVAQLYEVDPSRVRVLGSGYNEKIFHRDPTAPHDMTPDPLRLVYTGKLARAKGVPELLAACDEVSEHYQLHLTLIGSGADPLETTEIEEAAVEKDFPVALTGLLRQAEIARIYQKSHIFILPSYYEGMPLVVPEALACGLAVAVTDLPGFRDWLSPFQDRVALIPRPEMHTADEPTEPGRELFVQDITKAILDLAKTLGASPQPDLSSLTWAGLAGRIEGVIRELLNG